jgi:hypothetical protein
VKISKSPFALVILFLIGLISCGRNDSAGSIHTPYEDSLKQDAKKRQETFFASTNDETEKLTFAVGNFFGFYLINVETKANYCGQLGVDVAPFVTAFKRTNHEVYEKASSLAAKSGLSENGILFKLQQQLVDLTYKSMADQAQAQRITTTVVCERLRDYGARDPTLAYEKSNPTVYRMLMTAN